ncbi:MAG TPA: outer membrane protein transport protein [Gammaproteobacteria bacterium]|nr:outer membrane protein transport protein [Gammaproteobacteria bacterium]
MKQSGIRQLAAFILAGAVTGYAAQASAAGFAVNTPSAQGMGNAFAGGGAVAEDASTVWFNPASITRLPSQMMASAHVIEPTFEFSDRGSSQATGGPAIPLLPSAPNTDDGATTAFVPNFYYIRKLDERFTFGLSVNAPFGLATEYDGNWKGRYHAIESEIIDLNVNPVIAYKASDTFSIGAGVSLNYIDAKLTNAIDFVAVCAGSVPAAAIAGCTGIGAGPGQGANDGFVENEADDISYGFNFGLFYEPSDQTRYSLAYRSQINHKLEGDATFTTPSSIHAVGALDAAVRAAFANDGVKAGVTLPDSASFSVYHRVTSSVALMGDITWTGWSDIPELRIIFDNPVTAGGPGVESLNWEDTWRYSVGANYYASDRLTLRTGVAYDESPVGSPVFATPRLPDNDRLWVAVGASYMVNNKISVDFGYAHEFINDTNIARTNSTGATLNGVYESDADIFSLQVSYLFD